MAWIELHQAIWTHRKTFELAGILDMDETYAAAHLIRLWTWSLDNAPDGDLTRISDRSIALGAGYRGDATAFAQALTASGWLDDDRHIHDWYEYAGRLQDKREANAERMRKARATHKPITSVSSAENVHVTCDERAGATGPNRTVPDLTVPDTSAPAAVAAPPKRQPSPEAEVNPAPKPNKYAEVLDAIKALEPDHEVGGDSRIDGAAVKNCPAPAERIAKAYVGLLRGEWGGEFERNSLSIQFAVKRMAAFEANRRAPPVTPRNGRGGQTAVPMQSIEDQRRHYATSISGQGGGKAS